MYDVLIKNGMVIDGSGSPAQRRSIACRGGKIVIPASASDEAAKVIDASGMVVAPGFIDTHSHGDFPYGVSCNSLAKISQGITTHLGGQCGLSAFPLHPHRMEETARAIGLSRYPDRPLRAHTSFRAYSQYVRTIPAAENIGFFVGHETLRQSAMGSARRAPSDAEMQYMLLALEEALQNGALGMSTGLAYPPGAYADREELYRLCCVLKKYDAVYATHMRSEGKGIIDSVEEVIWLGKTTGCHVHISHLKVCGAQNFGLSEKIFPLLDQAISEGVVITADAYPYTASSTQLIFCLPPDMMDGGPEQAMQMLQTVEGRAQAENRLRFDETFDNIYLSCGGMDRIRIMSCPVTRDAQGKTIKEWGELHHYTGMEAFFQLLLQNHGDVGAMFYEIGEDDMKRILSDSRIMIGSDGAIDRLEDSCHPRTFGTFPRAIAQFVREEKKVAMEEMIRRMTSLAARTFQIKNKGLIAEGMDADLVIFDPEVIRDCASATDPTAVSRGIDIVIVSGEIVFCNGLLTGATPGTVVLRGGEAAERMRL